MTNEEAEVCFEKGFPVICTKSYGIHREQMVGQTYYLSSINKCFPKDNINKTIQTSYGVKSAKHGTNEGTLLSIEMKPLNSFNMQIQKILKKRKSEQFKAQISEYLAAGATQTRIIEKVKSVIKELKNA